MRLAAYAVATFFTPVFGYIGARIALSDAGANPIGMGFAQLTPWCIEALADRLRDDLTFWRVCSPASIAHGLEYLSLGVGGIALGLTAIVVAGARYAGTSDIRLAKVLPPIAWTYVVTVNLLAIPRVVLLAVLFFLVLVPALDSEAETYRENLTWVLRFAVTISILSIATNLFAFSLLLFRRPTVWGIVIDSEESTGLRELIAPIARRLGVSPPQNIVARLDANFGVTNEEVRIPGRSERLSGHTLLVSASMFRLLTMEELISTIGHEFGHLRRRDIVINMIVREPFARLDEAFCDGDQYERPTLHPSQIMPARICLNFLIDGFVQSVRKMTRNMEFKADDASLEVVSAEALITSGLKFVVYFMVLIEEISKDDSIISNLDHHNLSVELAELTRRKLELIADGELIAFIREHDPAAIGAGHIGFEERFARVGYSLEQALRLLPRTIENTVEGLLGDADDIERRATRQLRAELAG